MGTEYRTPDWDWDGIQHGFGPQETAVAEHLRLVRATQIHGADVVVVEAATPDHAGDADALITATPGIAVAIATADCVPVLLVAPREKAVAAVHAGWRGSLAGIVPRVVDALRAHFGASPEAMRAALGPSIGGCCYEVEREIAEKFAREFGDEIWSAWADGQPGKGRLDLRSVNEILLRRAGLPATSIAHVGPCTACGDGDLASYRVLGPRAGRQLSWVGLLA